MEVDPNELAREIEERLARIEGLADELGKQVKIVMQLRNDMVHEMQWASPGTKSQFEKIAEYLVSKGNKPKTASTIMKATGVSRSSLSQILYRTHKDSFVSIPMPGYARKKLWALTEDAARTAGQLGSLEQGTLFGDEGEFSGLRGTDCCVRILRDHGNEPMGALTLTREAIKRGYRGRAKGPEDEVLLTIAKSFWAAMSRDKRFEEVRPLVFRLAAPSGECPP